MNELAKLWEPIYQSRLEWRNRAINEYINSIKDEEIKDIVQRSMTGTVPVALYGKSQVGKTTFLLILLGIKDESLSLIYDILRCGSKPGAPATPTAMIYRRSQDESFRVNYGNHLKTFETLEGIREELVQLRGSIEKKEFSGLEEVIVEIPKRFFNLTGTLDIQVCDLPGIDSSNEYEREHVEKIIQKFIPISSLRLVFQRGNDINDVGNLFSKNVLSEVYGWKFHPHQYRLIITLAFSAASIPSMRMFQDSSDAKTDILSYYRNEANRDELNPNNLPEKVKIYPFEIGDSVNNLANLYSPAEIENIKLIMSSFWDEIREDINKAADSGNIVQRVLSYKPIIKEMIERYKSEMNYLSNTFEQRKIEKFQETETSRSRKISLSEELEELEKLIKSVNFVDVIEQLSDYGGGQNRNHMLEHIRSAENFIHDETKRVKELTNGQLEFSNELSEMHQITKERLDYLDGLKWDEPNFFNLGFGGPEASDISKINGLISSLNSIIEKRLNKKIRSWKSGKLEYLNGKKYHITQTINSIVKQLKEGEELFNSESNEFDNKINQLSKKLAVLQEDLEQKINIDETMKKFLQKETKSIMEGLSEYPAATQFLQLMKIGLLDKEYQKQIILGDIENG